MTRNLNCEKSQIFVTQKKSPKSFWSLISRFPVPINITQSQRCSYFVHSSQFTEIFLSTRFPINNTLPWSCTKFIGPYSHKYLAVPNYLGTGSSSRWQHDFFMLKHSSSTNIHKISQKTQFFHNQSSINVTFKQRKNENEHRAHK